MMRAAGAQKGEKRRRQYELSGRKRAEELLWLSRIEHGVRWLRWRVGCDGRRALVGQPSAFIFAAPARICNLRCSVSTGTQRPSSRIRQLTPRPKQSKFHMPSTSTSTFA